MRTIIANQTIYDQFDMGLAESPHSPDSLMLSFKEKDNDNVHLFHMTKDAAKKFAELINEHVTGKKLHIAGAHEMPKEKPNGK